MALMGVLQAVNTLGVGRLTDMLLAQVEQRTRVAMDKLRMALETQHLIADAVRGNRAELATGEQCGVCRELGDLILMTSYGSGAGSDAFVLKVRRALKDRRGSARSTQDYIANRVGIDYATYLRYRGEIVTG